MMSDLSCFFLACVAKLKAPEESIASLSGVEQFLQALKYLPEEGKPFGASSCLQTNRLALLALAAQFERVFEIQMKHAPGASFFGGTVSRRSFGIIGQDDDVVSVGGRGRTRQQAFESCVGEAAESLSFVERDNDPMITPITNAHGLKEEELHWALASAGLPKTTELRDIEWVETRSLLDDRKVLFPAELVLRRSKNQRRGDWPAESTGLGAGPTLTDATLSGLMEAVERDAASLWWFGGQTARVVSDRFLKQTTFNDFAASVRGGSDRYHWVLDITTDIGIPVVVVASAQPNGTGIVVGISANLDYCQAMRQALFEVCQMELAQELALTKLQQDGPDSLHVQDRNWVSQFERLNLDEFPQFTGVDGAASSWSPVRSTNLNFAVRKCRAAGLNPCVANLTRPEIDIPVVRVLVPGLQSSKPNYISQRLERTAAQFKRSLEGISRMISPI